MKAAVAYAFNGVCDASLGGLDAAGVEAAAHYGDEVVTRFIVENGQVATDSLDRDQLKTWVGGGDPLTGQARGLSNPSPQADLVLDATVNASKTFSIAAMLDADLAAAYAGLEDRLRERTIRLWQQELNARRGHAGAFREGLARIEVVELKHERSRSLDPHKHRHLWLNVKVQGQDGKWSNVDSRVAMKFQTVVNAEGDLAARTDPVWVAALVAKGFTFTADGEIAELQHLVRPLSRRSTQIEANRAVRTAEWRAANPGQEPDRDVLAGIDRWAWAYGRPNKPGRVDEESWGAAVRAEIAAIDPDILRPRSDRAALKGVAGAVGTVTAGVSVATVDRDLLAAMAIVDADKRSVGRGGRFSMFDVRGGVLRAVATTGIVADRAVLEELIEDVTARVTDGGHIVSLLADADQQTMPGHVKQLMATTTATVKTDLGLVLDRLTEPGVVLDQATVTDIAAKVLTKGKVLDSGQAAAAGAVAGTDRLVAVVGPAGAGKTTLLKVAKEALARQGRQMIVVAPTKKAATVAGREIGVKASSLHRLLLDYGYRWRQDSTGRTVWTRLRPGDTDPDAPATHAGVKYAGPSTQFLLRPRDRIVVDEASMVDLDAALALAAVAAECGAGIAMVGDPYQAMPVGHSGAMAMFAARATATVELDTVHRFRKSSNPLEADLDYAALTLRLRSASSDEERAAVAGELEAGGHVANVVDDAAVQAFMVEKYFAATGRRRTVALITGTNEQAQHVNEAIQRERIRRGQVDARRIILGQNDQAVHEGDVVQTRKNHAGHDVENRALWVVTKIRGDTVHLVSVTDSAQTRRIDREYAAENLHLAYASTVHGIQGETTDESYTGPGVDASGQYVGLTRGRFQNIVISTAKTVAATLEQLQETMRRGTVETSLDDARAAAQDELSRAARTPAPEPVVLGPSWRNPARPYGHVIDINQVAAATETSAAAARAQVSDIIETLRANDAALIRVDALLAAHEAHTHAAALGGGDQAHRPGDKAQLLAERTAILAAGEVARGEHRALWAVYTAHSEQLEAVTAERRLRNQLPPEQAAAEITERDVQQFRDRSATTATLYGGTPGPAVAPNIDGPNL